MEMPKCEDGRVCGGESKGFIGQRYLEDDGKVVFKLICGECREQAIKDALKRS